MMDKILFLACSFWLAFIVVGALAQDMPPAGAFVIRATGENSIPLYDAAGQIITIVSPGSDFSYFIDEGYALVIQPTP